MNRTVDKVFKDLQNKGMTRAFIQVGNQEYIYPPVMESNASNNIKTRWKTVAAVLVFGLIVAIWFLYGPDSRSSQNNKGNTALVGQGINEIKDIYGLTSLHHAVIRSDRQTVAQLIHQGNRIDARDNYDWTPLHWAVFVKDISLCQLLVQEGANPNIPSGKAWFSFPKGTTAKQMALNSEDKEINNIFTDAWKTPLKGMNHQNEENSSNKKEKK